MNINLRAKLHAQVYAGTFINMYTHIITLRSNDDLVIIQLPSNEKQSFVEKYGEEAIAKVREKLESILDNDLPFYPCVGSGFGLGVDLDEFVITTSYSSQGMQYHEFIPTTIKDKVI